MTADNENMKLELFKALLANPSNHIDGLNVEKAVETVERMLQAITDPKFGMKSTPRE